MTSLSSRNHKTWRKSFQDRAEIANTPPLCAYLFRLMASKRSNLCLSADVESTAQLLEVAEECGDSICVIKTHADIVKDFSERTIKGLREIALRKKFLIFEDRKFGDIGSTVQAQYGAGPHHIADWASITNAHIFPGPAIITALKATANAAIMAYSSSSSTQITAGRPGSYFPTNTSESSSSTVSAGHNSRAIDGEEGEEEEEKEEEEPDEADSVVPYIEERGRDLAHRKSSVVSISTTISSSTEYLSPPACTGTSNSRSTTGALAHRQVDDPPLARGLLLLAQMSSADNLFTPAYTATCLTLARQHPDFVIGFIAQESLNAAPDDNFITMTPGVNLPPPPQSTPKTTLSTSTAPTSQQKRGDGLGQQYNTPRHVILQKGCDVAIVGRGILGASDRGAAAERYRAEAWAAYMERIGANELGKSQKR